MSSPPLTGTKVGPYDILESLGKGGMGEVNRGRDTRLEREDAVKTLPTESASDGDRLARFEREACLLASLNHPNIAAIYGLEDGGGTRLLILELVEGETLAETPPRRRGPRHRRPDCWSTSEASHMSLVGIGVPCFRSWRTMLA